jgi:hypothetical protein
MRIVPRNCAIRLRFLPFNGENDATLETMKYVQQQLGEIRDCDVWISYIPFSGKKRSNDDPLLWPIQMPWPLTTRYPILLDNRHLAK